ncbi:MAG: DUF2334 domain-containing protein [Lachnospiraceae bacterium]|nr:DUF2334 domain-containing protein [Lachnospiraceae bacterium]MDE6185416.1 DUF2334 domain-containing protein [Lachnospiraceae bacterium]
MKIAVRLDDITPDMDWERFFKFKALLDRYQVKPLIGVVPENRDDNLKKQSSNKPEDFWNYVKDLEKDGWTLAMHGVHHLYTTGKGGIFPLNNFSEFAGLPFAQQKDMLLRGKQRLEERGVKTEIFMAPAHSYDRNTLKALKETGFTAVTDGFGNYPYLWRGLKFYPISFHLSSTFQKKKGFSTMVVHTDTIVEEDLQRYESYFQNKNIEWISFREYIDQPARRITIFTRIKEFLMAKGKYLIVKGRSGSK